MTGALRPEVSRWFARHTFSTRDFLLDELVDLKAEHTVSVVIPAKDEERTIAPIVRTLVELADQGLVDEVVVMDSRSSDGTARVAAAAGAAVYPVDEIRPELGAQEGKGEALWKSLLVTKGDVLVFLDGDVEDLPASYVTGLLGPVLTYPEIAYVKGAYDRPVTGAAGGGRVTELVARPLLNAHWPQLAGFVQPLAGESAARRGVLEQVPFACGYGVELGLLVDLLDLVGLRGLAQVDLGERRHRNRPDSDLAPMAAAIVHAAAQRLPVGAGPAGLARFTRLDGHFTPESTLVQAAERPPTRPHA